MNKKHIITILSSSIYISLLSYALGKFIERERTKTYGKVTIIHYKNADAKPSMVLMLDKSDALNKISTSKKVCFDVVNIQSGETLPEGIDA